MSTPELDRLAKHFEDVHSEGLAEMRKRWASRITVVEEIAGMLNRAIDAAERT